MAARERLVFLKLASKRIVALEQPQCTFAEDLGGVWIDPAGQCVQPFRGLLERSHQPPCDLGAAHLGGPKAIPRVVLAGQDLLQGAAQSCGVGCVPQLVRLGREGVHQATGERGVARLGNLERQRLDGHGEGRALAFGGVAKQLQGDVSNRLGAHRIAIPARAALRPQ